MTPTDRDITGPSREQTLQLLRIHIQIQLNELFSELESFRYNHPGITIGDISNTLSETNGDDLADTYLEWVAEDED